MTRRPDLVPLNSRLGVLQAVRLAMALGVVVSVLSLPDVIAGADDRVVALTVAYGLATAVVELLRRSARARALWLVSAMLVIDAVWITLVVGRTGGTVSLLGFLAYFHVVAVTLLLSWRTGVRVALWHAVLVMATHVGMAAGFLPHLTANNVTSSAIYESATVIVVALVTAACSALNEGALRRGKAELRALVDLGTGLERGTTPADLGACLLQHVTRDFGFRRAALVTVHDEGWWATLTEAGTTLFAEGRDRAALGWRPDEESTRLVRRLDAGADALLDTLLPNAANAVVVPLVVDRTTLGVLVAEWGPTRGATIPSQTVEALVQAASHAALSLRNAWLAAEVERLATRDVLTGLANRRVFDETLRREVERARRTGQPLSLVLLDVDHFKTVNDKHGHQSGDGVLRGVGTALAHEVRSMDVACRYGGEEFAVVLPGCTPAEAMRAAERLRSAIADADAPVAVTASAGVATFPLNADDPEGLLAAADAALYNAKRRGRDRASRSRRRRTLAA